MKFYQHCFRTTSPWPGFLWHNTLPPSSWKLAILGNPIQLSLHWTWYAAYNRVNVRPPQVPSELYRASFGVVLTFGTTSPQSALCFCSCWVWMQCNHPMRLNNRFAGKFRCAGGQEAAIQRGRWWSDCDGNYCSLYPSYLVSHKPIYRSLACCGWEGCELKGLYDDTNTNYWSFTVWRESKRWKNPTEEVLNALVIVCSHDIYFLLERLSFLYEITRFGNGTKTSENIMKVI